MKSNQAGSVSLITSPARFQERIFIRLGLGSPRAIDLVQTMVLLVTLEKESILGGKGRCIAFTFISCAPLVILPIASGADSAPVSNPWRLLD